MKPAITHFPLFGFQAESPSIYHEMGGRFREGGANYSTWHLVALVLVGLALAAGLWWLARYVQRSDNGYNHPQKLFRQLCRAHRIGRGQRRLLRELARGHQLDQPSRLFVEPHRFDKIPLELESQRSQLRTLRKQLFAESTG